MIELPDVFRDLLTSLCECDADFVVVGGYAVAFYGHPRATKDIDVLIRPELANAERVHRALKKFGAPLEASGVSAEDLSTYDGVLQVGVPPYRIDLSNRATGIAFDEAVADSSSFDVDGNAVRVIGLAALLKNKRAAARPQDVADVAALAQLRGRAT